MAELAATLQASLGYFLHLHHQGQKKKKKYSGHKAARLPQVSLLITAGGLIWYKSITGGVAISWTKHWDITVQIIGALVFSHCQTGSQCRRCFRNPVVTWIPNIVSLLLFPPWHCQSQREWTFPVNGAQQCPHRDPWQGNQKQEIKVFSSILVLFQCDNVSIKHWK